MKKKRHYYLIAVFALLLTVSGCSGQNSASSSAENSVISTLSEIVVLESSDDRISADASSNSSVEVTSAVSIVEESSAESDVQEPSVESKAEESSAESSVSAVPQKTEREYLEEYYNNMQKSGTSLENELEYLWTINNHVIRDYNNDGSPELVVSYEVTNELSGSAKGQKLAVIKYENGDYIVYQRTPDFDSYLTLAGGERFGNIDQLYVENGSLCLMYYFWSMDERTTEKIYTYCINSSIKETGRMIVYNTLREDNIVYQFDTDTRFHYLYPGYCIDRSDPGTIRFSMYIFLESDDASDKDYVTTEKGLEFFKKLAKIDFVQDFRAAGDYNPSEFKDEFINKISNLEFCSEEEFKKEFYNKYPQYADSATHFNKATGP